MQQALKDKIIAENIWIHSQIKNADLKVISDSIDSSSCNCDPVPFHLSFSPNDTSLKIPASAIEVEKIISEWRNRKDRKRVKFLSFSNCDTIRPELIELFPEVESIRIQGSRKIDGLSSFRKVKKINLRFCYNPNIMEEVKKIRGLKILHSYHSHVGENTLRNLKQLEELNLYMSGVESPLEINQLTKLRKLEIRRMWRLNNQSEFDFSNMKCLNHLVLTGNPNAIGLPKGIENLQLERLNYYAKKMNREDSVRLNIAKEKIRIKSFELQKQNQYSDNNRLN